MYGYYLDSDIIVVMLVMLIKLMIMTIVMMVREMKGKIMLGKMWCDNENKDDNYINDNGEAKVLTVTIMLLASLNLSPN